MESKKKKKVLKNLGAGQEKDADVENGLEDMGRRKGKLREWHGYIYTTKCEIYTAKCKM